MDPILIRPKNGIPIYPSHNNMIDPVFNIDS